MKGQVSFVYVIKLLLMSPVDKWVACYFRKDILLFQYWLDINQGSEMHCKNYSL